MIDVKIVLPLVSNDEVILTGIFETYSITYRYKIIKETLAYRPVALSFEEAKHLFLYESDCIIPSKFTDVNGNSFYAQLKSITYIGAV